MKTILFTLAAIAALSVPFASQTQAGPHDGRSGHSNSGNHSTKVVASSKTVSSNHMNSNNFSRDNHGKFSNNHLTNGTKFAHGYFYRGREHNHWTSHRFDSRYGCECYFDPCCSCWYYWCQPASCFYPVTYCPYQVYCWSPVVQVQSAPCVTCTSVIEPVSVQTITRTTFVRTTVSSQPVVGVTGGPSLPDGGPQASGIPAIPAPLARQ